MGDGADGTERIMTKLYTKEEIDAMTVEEKKAAYDEAKQETIRGFIALAAGLVFLYLWVRFFF